MKNVGNSSRATAVKPVTGTRIYASFNARYFAVQHDADVALFRNTTLLWRKRFIGLISVYYISTCGDVFVRTEEGLLVQPALVGSPTAPVAWESSLKGRVERLVEMDPIRINETGDACATHIVNAPTPPKHAWKNLISFPSAEKKQNVIHTVCTMSNPEEPARVLYSKSLSPQAKFFWGISPSFNYLIVALSDGKNGYNISLLRGEDLVEVGNFHLRSCTILRLQVRNSGRVILTLRPSPKELSLVVRELNGHSESIEIPANTEIFHVWDNFICLRDKKELIVRRFDGGECCRADVSPLEQIGGKFAFFFNHKDDLALVSLNNQQLQFVPIEPLNLANDSKRWQKMLSYKKEYEAAQATEKQQQVSDATVERETFETRHDQLTSSLEEIVSQRLRKELDERIRLGKVTTAQISSAVNNALQFAQSKSKNPLKVPEYLEIQHTKKASVVPPAKPKLELQMPPAPARNAIAPIVNQIKELCELLQAGKIGQDEYTLQLSLMSAKLVYYQAKK